MSPQELRIGNYVKSYGKLMRVVEIGLNGLLCTNEEGQSAHSNTSVNWEGEPLTEEWLIKFGFKFHSEYAAAGVRMETFYILGDRWAKIQRWTVIGRKDTVWKWPLGEYRNSELPYVHTLQNLYLALTGSELTIKE